MSRKKYLDFDNLVDIQTDINESSTLETVIDEDITFGITLDDATTQDHSKLYHRDQANSHPITAITGLQEALDSKVNKENLILDCGTSTTNIYEE